MSVQNQRKSKREKGAERRAQMEGSSKWPLSATSTINLNHAKSPQQLHKPQIVHTRARPLQSVPTSNKKIRKRCT